MKKTILMMTGLLLSILSSAGNRTEVQMRQIAARAVAAAGGVAQARSVSQHADSLTAELITDHLCLFTAADGSFAVITRDDRQPAVLAAGPSLQSKGEEAARNPEFDWYLQAADAALSTGRPLRRVAPDTDKYPARVDNLLTTTWSQDEPYKNHTPLMANGDNYVTGCVATSMAQVLAYHRLPMRGQGEASVTSPLGQKLTASFGTTLYDWDRMKPSYNYLEQDYTFEEGEAVATLMAHCGVACKMAYNETGSGAFNDDAAQGLQQYFGFRNARNVRRSSYPNDEAWMNLIFDELAHHAPVMFGAQSTYGHSFVFSGYNEEGLVYVNWGWGGQKNGWFDVNVLDPDQNGGFVTNQQMIIGVRSYQPDVDEATVTTTVAGSVASLLDPAKTYGRLKIVGPIDETDLEHLRSRIMSARINDYPNAADTYALDLSEAVISDLPDKAFNGCTNLRYLTLPAMLKTIGAGAFGGCMALTDIKVPAEAVGGDYVVDDNIIYNGDCTRVVAVLADAMGTLRLDDGVTHIGDCAFASLYAVEKIDLPQTVASIGTGVFSSGSRLEQLWMRPSVRPALADRSVFSPIAAQTFLYVHAANKSVYRSVPYSTFAGTRLFGTLVRATSNTREYGQSNPRFGYTVEGDDVTGEPELVCDATPQSPVGTYPIYCRQGSVQGDDVVFQDGTLYVTQTESVSNSPILNIQSSTSHDLQGRPVNRESLSPIIITDGRKQTHPRR